MQRHLYQVMAEVAAPGENASRFRAIGEDQVAWLEGEIDRLSKEVEMPTGFLLGGESIPGGALDLARTVVRRAERRVALLADQGEVENRQLLRYLNRASSICFLLILVSYRRAGLTPTMAKEGRGRRDRNLAERRRRPDRRPRRPGFRLAVLGPGAADGAGRAGPVHRRDRAALVLADSRIPFTLWAGSCSGR